jgi:hypothetical protein
MRPLVGLLGSIGVLGGFAFGGGGSLGILTRFVSIRLDLRHDRQKYQRP